MKNLRHTILVLLAIAQCLSVSAQPDEISMTFPVKDFHGNVEPLNERLDPEKNYLILFSAFWCQPCVNAINYTHSEKIEEYREQYNLEVIILDDEHYNRVDLASSKIKAFQWRFQMYMLDDLYGDLGINSIPQYYFLPAGETNALIASRSRYLDEIEDYYADQRMTTTLYQANRQVIAYGDCTQPVVHKFSIEDTTDLSGQPYIEIDDHAYNTEIISRNLYRYDPLTQQDVLVFDYHLRHCDAFELRDYQGDALTLYAEEVTKEEGHITIITDAVISNGCGEDIPFVMSTQYGSNAGIHFDIEDGVISSRLVCHEQNGNQTYSDPSVADLCSSVTTVEQKTELVSLTNNPGNGQFEILGLAQKGMSINIYDMDGSKVKVIANSTRLDLSDLMAGTYLLRVSVHTQEVQTLQYIKI